MTRYAPGEDHLAVAGEWTRFMNALRDSAYDLDFEVEADTLAQIAAQFTILKMEVNINEMEKQQATMPQRRNPLDFLRGQI